MVVALCCYLVWCCDRIDVAKTVEDKCFSCIAMFLTATIIVSIVIVVVTHGGKEKTVENKQKVELKKEN